jgi:glycosyltransferase involved in cell wall biosynthesis
LGEKCVANKCLSETGAARTYFDRISPFVFKNYVLHRNMPIIILESQAQINCVLQNGYRKEQVAWLPNFTPVRAEDEVIEFNKKYYNPDENHILFVGRASYEKGVDVILDAAPLLKTGCTIHLVTGGPYMEHVNRRVRKEKLHNVDVVGILSYDETRKYYAKSDIVLVPSVWIESFCLVGLEAMANRKPVIGSRIGGIKDWLVDGVTGYHFEPGNARELASKVDYLLDNKSLATKMGEKGYERVKTHYSKVIYIERLVGIYQRAVKYVHEVRTA